MIRNAREALKIISKTQGERDSSWHRIGGSDLFHEAEGFIQCLEHSEEVRALVERLQDRSEGCLCGVNENDCEECNKDKKVIADYFNSLKPEGK